MGKYLFKEVSVPESAGIVLSKSGEMWNLIHHFKTKEPPVSDIHFSLSDCLPHASNSIQMLDKRDLSQHDRIHTWTPVIGTILKSEAFALDFVYSLNRKHASCFLYNLHKKMAVFR